MKKICHANNNHEIARMAILASDKIDQNMKNIIRDDKSFQSDKKENLSGIHTIINLNI